MSLNIIVPVFPCVYVSRDQMQHDFNLEIIVLVSSGSSFISLSSHFIPACCLGLTSCPLLLHPAVPSSQLNLFCGFLFLFTKARPFYIRLRRTNSLLHIFWFPLQRSEVSSSSYLQDIIPFYLFIFDYTWRCSEFALGSVLRNLTPGVAVGSYEMLDHPCAKNVSYCLYYLSGFLQVIIFYLSQYRDNL